MTDVRISGLSTKSDEPSDALDDEDWIAITDGATTKKMQRSVFIGPKLLAIKSISSGGVLATDASGNPGKGTVSLPLTYTPASRTISINVATSGTTGVVSYDNDTIKMGTGSQLFANAAGIVHDSLSGLTTGDAHTQYLTTGRHATTTIHTLGTVVPHDTHSLLSGLGNNDHTQYILHSLATAANDFLVSSGTGVFIKKTLAQTKTILGLGTAAYTNSTAYLAYDGKAVDSDKLDNVDSTGYVNTTTTQTIGGAKTFSVLPTLPTTTPTANQATTKTYVDTQVASAGKAYGGGVVVSGTTITPTLPAGWSAKRDDVGRYTITHNLNANTGVTVTGNNKFAVIYTTSLNSFTVILWGYDNTTKIMAAYDASFWFTVVKV